MTNPTSATRTSVGAVDPQRAAQPPSVSGEQHHRGQREAHRQQLNGATPRRRTGRRCSPRTRPARTRRPPARGTSRRREPPSLPESSPGQTRTTHFFVERRYCRTDERRRRPPGSPTDPDQRVEHRVLQRPARRAPACRARCCRTARARPGSPSRPGSTRRRSAAAPGSVSSRHERVGDERQREDHDERGVVDHLGRSAPAARRRP